MTVQKVLPTRTVPRHLVGLQDGAGKRVLTLRKRSDGLWLYVSRRGLNISIR